MNKHYGFLYILVAITLITTACSVQSVRAEQDVPRTVNYNNVLGKSLKSQEVIEFIAVNSCTEVTAFQICKEVGIALWLDSEWIVRTVYLYLNNTDSFSAYRGGLPFGLKFYDIMGAVEYKLSKQGIGNDGLPDETAVPDRMHYWAFYNEHGLTIIYNSPFADEDATIYAVIIND